MQVFVIVKGSDKDAHREADRLGIKLANVRVRTAWDETCAETESDPDTLNRWFTREVAVDREGNFPPGSLLFWSPIGDTTPGGKAA